MATSRATTVVLQVRKLAFPAKLIKTASQASLGLKNVTSDGVPETRPSTYSGASPKAKKFKGYQYDADKFITFTEQELKDLVPRPEGTVEIVEFVPIPELNPSQVEASFHVKPGKGANEAFHLLARTMRQKRKAAVAKYQTKNRDNLCVVVPGDDRGLTLYQVFYENEQREFDEEVHMRIANEELASARKLVDVMTEREFTPSRHQDEYVQKVLEVVEQRKGGKKVVVVPPEAADLKLDIPKALKASLK